MDPEPTGILTSRSTIPMTDDDNFKLVKEVQKHPLLYNPALLNYNRRQKTDKAWDKVGAAMNVSGSLCKERWKNIRVVLKRSLSNTNKRKRPYYLADAMKFLLPYMSQGNKSSVPTVETTTTANDNSELEIKIEEDSESSYIMANDDTENNVGYAGSTDGTSDSFDDNETKPAPSRAKTSDHPVTAFLESLEPELKEMTFDQFKMFKRKVLALVDDIVDGKTK